jgi:hypothetical protein
MGYCLSRHSVVSRLLLQQELSICSVDLSLRCLPAFFPLECSPESMHRRFVVSVPSSCYSTIILWSAKDITHRKVPNRRVRFFKKPINRTIFWNPRPFNHDHTPLNSAASLQTPALHPLWKFLCAHEIQPLKSLLSRRTCLFPALSRVSKILIAGQPLS